MTTSCICPEASWTTWSSVHGADAEYWQGLIATAGVVKWHHTTFPRLERGFDSRHPLHAARSDVRNGRRLGAGDRHQFPGRGLQPTDNSCCGVRVTCTTSLPSGFIV